MITASLDTSRLLLKLERLAEVSEKGMGELIRQESRLLAVVLAKYTQPFGFNARSRALGMGAVQRDFRKVFHSPNSKSLLQQIAKIARPNDPAVGRFQSYIIGSDFSKARKMLKKMHVGNIGVRPDLSYYRIRWKNGELKSGPSQVVLNQQPGKEGGAEQGRHRRRVGFAASGWATAADQVGGHRGIPGWKAKHKAPGRVIDRTQDTAKPTLTLVNEVRYTSQVLSESAQRHAIKDRLFALDRRIDTELRLKLREASLQSS